MEGPKHTPGPWLAEGGDCIWGVWFNEGKGRLASLDRSRDGHEPFRNAAEADARLIAAAPEMYAALKELVAEDGNAIKGMALAVAALSKAGGEQ